MKLLKKTLLILSLLIIVVVLFRAWLFKASISYTPIQERSTILLVDPSLLQELDLELKNTKLSIEEIISLAQRKTNKKLYFSTSKSSKDPNIVAQEGKANCVGYAALFSSIVNFILQSQQLERKYQVNHLVGKISFLGLDLHSFFDSPFFKDHDYNEIINLETKCKIYVDPVISAYLGIHRVSSITQ